MPTSPAQPRPETTGPRTPFADRHLGHVPDAGAYARATGHESLEALVEATVPAGIRMREPLDLPPALDEEDALAELRRVAARNRVVQPMIGLGYHGTVTPPVVRRNVLQDPAWYTAYTPYQPEISQGRLEALLTFQTLVTDLTGLDVANASLLDEPTAAAEAMTLLRRAAKAPDDAVFLVDTDTLPQTRAVLQTRAEPLGIALVDLDLGAGVDAPADAVPAALAGRPVFGALLQYPGASGQVRDLRAVVAAVVEAGGRVAVAADPLALTLLTPPGEQGADVVVGSMQRFGVPMGYGGPHAGYMAVRDGLQRLLPGRLVGVSKDAAGRPALRLALQTREQHIRREKATSNICTAQVLLAVIAGMYAVWHGPEGLRRIARHAHDKAAQVAGYATAVGLTVETTRSFDTVTVQVPDARQVVARALEGGVNIRLVDDGRVAVTADETTRDEHVRAVTAALLAASGCEDGPEPSAGAAQDLGDLARQSKFCTNEVFSRYRSETGLLRYLRRLADADFALDRGMIPLGSCTMKLNATTEMESITWSEFADLHPFAPADQAAGTRQVVADLETWLAEVTGYDAVSMQPNSGAQGELAGLLAIRGYHHAHGDTARDVCLIPSSAHGTNAASAVMAGMRVVVVACDADGNVDVDDLRARIETHRDALAALMITYPSTHGVFEEAVTEICDAVHEAGGQVYLDGANLNALVGLARPGKFGADVSHLNLHKTFCIPHGGGGPGVGPIGVREHLRDFLPGHPLEPTLAGNVVGPVSGAPYGSAGILTIPWTYVRMMGAEGLTEATTRAIAAANYVAARLRGHWDVLYTGRTGTVAHECILDVRPVAKSAGVTVDDIAKRLVDHGFHAPTMSWPVAGTLMVEPTESEDQAELDRFCDAMIAIREEIARVEAGEWAVADSPLRHAPHTAEDLTDDAWDRPYPRRLGAYPSGTSRGKYWPPVGRIDGAYGDRNLVCACPPVSAFGEAEPGAAVTGTVPEASGAGAVDGAPARTSARTVGAAGR
ncbi:aminomethyl-transferring glycine dehydrogenase [Aquipuribacter hungaricus]|uniref:Glycine dehydrogenase (decarboxylating) n=1 Tax=Aquipuribacter hungaricus TaxID=545624 RepID=A0ABV7WDC1_9MICO